VGGSSILISVEYRLAGKMVRKIGPDQIDAWIDEAIGRVCSPLICKCA